MSLIKEKLKSFPFLFTLKDGKMKQPRIDYIDEKSILVINQNGKMRQLHCPFKVQVLRDASPLQKDSWVIVESVKLHQEKKLIYRIGDQWWQYDIFIIKVVY